MPVRDNKLDIFEALIKMKKSICLLIGSSLALNGCANMQPIQKQVHDTFASEDPCSNNSRNTSTAVGVVVGAGLGVLLSKATGGNSRDAIATGALLGTGIGAAVGWNVGKNMDRQRCELFKISQRYNINLRSTPITASDQKDPIGLSITLPDNNRTGHFARNSDVLTPEARRYFTEIARQYSITYQLYHLPPTATANEREAIKKQLTNKKILLVGHTDDTGSTQHNADLSESRARAVAQLFREHGVPETNLLFQGAGETLPIADNNIEAGRQLNRRVEIIDVNDETALQTYLASRQPNLAFYRTDITTDGDAIIAEADSDKQKAAVPSTKPAKKIEHKVAVVSGATSKQKPSVGKTASRADIPSPTPATNTAKQPAAQVSNDGLNLGGVPLTSKNAILSVGSLPQSGGFSLFSKAYASDVVLLHSCNIDRPRAAGMVKQLSDGKIYAVRDHLPGLYGGTWKDTLNGNLIVINHFSVLRDSAQVDMLPQVKIYKDYNPAVNRNPNPTLSEVAQVNTYRGDKGILFRMFIGKSKSLKCMDVLLPVNGGLEAQNGRVVYNQNTQTMVAQFKPKAY